MIDYLYWFEYKEMCGVAHQAHREIQLAIKFVELPLRVYTLLILPLPIT